MVRITYMVTFRNNPDRSGSHKHRQGYVYQQNNAGRQSTTQENAEQTTQSWEKGLIIRHPVVNMTESKGSCGS